MAGQEDQNIYYLGRKYGEAFLNYETSDYGGTWVCTDDNGCFDDVAHLYFENKEMKWSVSLRISEIPEIIQDESDDTFFSDAKFEVYVHEEYIKEVKYYDSSIKYLYISIL